MERTASTGAEVLHAGERRQLTILFCDVVDSTGIAQSMDPEDWREVLAPVLSKVAEVVVLWGGHVARSLGDGLLVYFGWPSAREHDAERAIRAGLAILETLATLPPLAAAGGARISMRVGIHTGPVVVEDGGEVFGDTTHIAARVQSAGDPGSVFVTESTLRLVGGLFLVEDRGLHDLKGVREPVALYRVVRPSGVRSRLGIAGTRLTPFVGREEDLSMLGERWERVVRGAGQAVVVLAEAGIGKSRFAYEFRERLAAVPHTWLECAGTPYTAGTPFHPVIALVAQRLGIHGADADAERLAKIERGLGTLATPENLALLSHFLGLTSAEPMQMSPVLQRRKTLELLENWTLAMSVAQPLVLFVEDLHWCDASTLELIGALVARSRGAGPLLLLTARPEFALPWPRSEHVAVIELARLTEKQARDMISSLAGDDLPAGTVGALVERADGVPLYVEELTTSVVDPAGRRGVDAIPATLADSLMSRLDRLLSIKDVAQRAAVIGREFSFGLLEVVTEVGGFELELALTRLCEAQILFATGTPPEATYSFKHALVQEAAYASLLKRTRQQLHARIATTLEQDASGHGAAEPEVIARHYEQAGSLRPSIAHYLRAGQVAIQRSANEEAIGHLRRGLSLVESLPESQERDRVELQLRMTIGSPLVAVRSWADSECTSTYVRARELTSRMGQTPELPRVLSALAATYFVRAEFGIAVEVADEALVAASRTGDAYDILYAHQCLGIPLMYRGDFRRSLHHLSLAMELYDQEAHGHYAYTEGIDRGVMARVHAALCWHALGHADRAASLSERGVDLARSLKHPLSLTHAVFVAGTIYFNGEQPDPLRRHVGEMLDLAERFGFPMYTGLGHVLVGGAIALDGESGRALETIQQGFFELAQIDVRIGAPMVVRMLADAQRQAGLFDEALASVELGLALAAERDQHFDDVELYRVRGQTLIDSGDSGTGAERDLESAIAIARQQDARSFELRAANVLAQLWYRRGKTVAARELLEPLYGWFTEGFGTGDLKTAKRLLDELR